MKRCFRVTLGNCAFHVWVEIGTKPARHYVVNHLWLKLKVPNGVARQCKFEEVQPKLEVCA